MPTVEPHHDSSHEPDGPILEVAVVDLPELFDGWLRADHDGVVVVLLDRRLSYPEAIIALAEAVS